MGVPTASIPARAPLALMASGPTAGGRTAGAVMRPIRRIRRLARRAVSEDVSANGSVSDSELQSLNFDELTNIIRMVNDSDIVELELKRKGFNLSVKKKEALEEAAAPGMPPYAPVALAPPPAVAAPPPVAAPAPAPVPTATPPQPAAAPASQGGREVTSPMAGTFYRSPAPGEAAFVKEGDKVNSGQTICIVEAMKLMNEIEADCDGEVVKFLVENGSAVSPGTPLLLLK
eukprot:evm.model.scf_2549.2 EVM.evm.TU.scf_2549.2   scf_2549:18145-21525(-)